MTFASMFIRKNKLQKPLSLPALKRELAHLVDFFCGPIAITWLDLQEGGQSCMNLS